MCNPGYCIHIHLKMDVLTLFEKNFLIGVNQSTVQTIRLDRLLFNTLNSVLKKVMDVLTFMYVDVCSYVHSVTWCCW